MSDEPKLLMDRLGKLRPEVTDEPLHESGRYFNEGTFWDLTQCTHGDTGRFRNDADGKAIAILWELWRSGALVPAPAVPDDVVKVCANCGSSMTDAELEAWRAEKPGVRVSCCPERKMGPLTREVYDEYRDHCKAQSATIEAQAAELARLRGFAEFVTTWAMSFRTSDRDDTVWTTDQWRELRRQIAALTQPTGDRT